MSNGNGNALVVFNSEQYALAPVKVPPPPDRYEHSRYLNFRGDPRDWGVPFLAMFGFSNKVIARQQNLTEGQVSYRLRKLNAGRPPEQRICAWNYRNGTSPVAQLAIQAIGRKVKAMLAPAISHRIAAETHVINI
jgi:hypothetical protein